jgi:hypothetical protein
VTPQQYVSLSIFEWIPATGLIKMSSPKGVRGHSAYIFMNHTPQAYFGKAVSCLPPKACDITVDEVA